jgi:signal transduction histidine kinase
MPGILHHGGSLANQHGRDVHVPLPHTGERAYDSPRTGEYDARHYTAESSARGKQTKGPAVTTPTRFRRALLSPKDWRLRVKLVVLVLIPAVLAVALGGLRIASAVGDAAALDRATRYAQAQGLTAGLVQRLQAERIAATTYAATADAPGGRDGDTGALAAAVAATDRAAAEAMPAARALEGGDGGVAEARAQLEQAMTGLGPVRDLARAPGAPVTQLAGRYTALIAGVVPLDRTLLAGVGAGGVTGLTAGLDGLAAAREQATLQVAVTAAARIAGTPPADLLAPLVAADARLTTGLQDFRAALDPAQRTRYAGLITGASNTARAAAVARLVAGTADGRLAVEDSSATLLGEIDRAETGMRAELVATTQTRRAAAVDGAVASGIALLVALLLAATVAFLLARQMLGSLRTLRSAALDVAGIHLPEAVQRMRGGDMPDMEVRPVPVTSREEVGEVARAFDAVHRQAVRLAAEQATLQSTVNSMFVNMSRRSQSLVDKQLQLIEELERGEQDADQLANLFRLDHLATRMRRNSENLLVLAGTDLARRATHRVPFVDVLRAAVSETEQYERISLGEAPDVAVAGRAASDLQHLIAELLDNATTFSSPGSPVDLAATADADGGLVVEIADRGVGMPAGEIASANALLARRSEVSVTASRRMGLFVVARLAARHGIQVRLTSGPAPDEGGPRGLTARVTVPQQVVVTGPGVPAARPPAETPLRSAAVTAGPDTSARRFAATESGRVPDRAAGREPAVAREESEPQAAPARPRAPTVPVLPPLIATLSQPDAAPYIGAAATPPREVPSGSDPDPVVPAPRSAPESRPDSAPDDGPASAPDLAPWEAPDPAGEVTPIFEEVASGWFRTVHPAGEDEPLASRHTVDRPEPDVATGDVPVPPVLGGDHGFDSPLDHGRAAAEAVAALDRDERQTGSGLPRRTPGLRLLPGNPDGDAFLNRPGVHRDPDAVRERLAGYQRGVTRGRHARGRDAEDRPGDG